MEYIPEAGDVVGMEVWIVYANHSYWATVQLAEGVPRPPIVVPVHVSGNAISFTVPGLGTESETSRHETAPRFVGEVNRSELTSTFANGRVLLRRTKSYWQ